MKYLIMICKPLSDQWECDADRTPFMITDNWQAHIPANELFEVWEVKDDGTLGKVIKSYNTPMESGMAYGYWDTSKDEDAFVLIKKYPDRTRDDECPNTVTSKFKELTDVDDWLENCGYISGLDEALSRYYVYGEYFDHQMPRGC